MMIWILCALNLVAVVLLLGVLASFSITPFHSRSEPFRKGAFNCGLLQLFVRFRERFDREF
jgi:hypothetical protein